MVTHIANAHAILCAAAAWYISSRFTYFTAGKLAIILRSSGRGGLSVSASHPLIRCNVHVLPLYRSRFHFVFGCHAPCLQSPVILVFPLIYLQVCYRSHATAVANMLSARRGMTRYSRRTVSMVAQRYIHVLGRDEADGYDGYSTVCALKGTVKWR